MRAAPETFGDAAREEKKGIESNSHEGLIKLLLVAGPALLLCVVCVC